MVPDRDTSVHQHEFPCSFPASRICDPCRMKKIQRLELLITMISIAVTHTQVSHHDAVSVMAEACQRRNKSEVELQWTLLPHERA